MLLFMLLLWHHWFAATVLHASKVLKDRGRCKYDTILCNLHRMVCISIMCTCAFGFCFTAEQPVEQNWWCSNWIIMFNVIMIIVLWYKSAGFIQCYFVTAGTYFYIILLFNMFKSHYFHIKIILKVSCIHGFPKIVLLEKPLKKHKIKKFCLIFRTFWP